MADTRQIGVQAVWAVSGIVLAVVLFRLLGFSSEQDAARILDAARRGDVEGVRAAVEGGVDPDVATREGWTALHYAAYLRSRPTVDALLALGADADARSISGQSPLHRVAHNGDVGIARALVAHGGSVDAATREGETPLVVALRRGRVALARYLLDQGARLDAREPRTGAGVLELAVMANDAELVGRLIDAGAPMNGRLPDGLTALHLAAGMGSPEIVDRLLAHGVPPDLPDAAGNTALHLAARGQRLAVVRRLLRAGADPERRNAAGRTPRDLVGDGAPEALRALLAPAPSPSVAPDAGACSSVPRGLLASVRRLRPHEVCSHARHGGIPS